MLNYLARVVSQQGRLLHHGRSDDVRAAAHGREGCDGGDLERIGVWNREAARRRRVHEIEASKSCSELTNVFLSYLGMKRRSARGKKRPQHRRPAAQEAERCGGGGHDYSPAADGFLVLTCLSSKTTGGGGRGGLYLFSGLLSRLLFCTIRVLSSCSKSSPIHQTLC